MFLVFSGRTSDAVISLFLRVFGRVCVPSFVTSWPMVQIDLLILIIGMVTNDDIIVTD